jgi:hypothetical protein
MIPLGMLRPVKRGFTVPVHGGQGGETVDVHLEVPKVFDPTEALKGRPIDGNSLRGR